MNRYRTATVALAVLFSGMVLNAGCRKLNPRTDVTSQSDVVKEECPGPGSAVELPDAGLQLKVHKVQFFRKIGKDRMAESAADKVFALVDLEWVPERTFSGDKPLPEVTLRDGKGNALPVSSAGTEAFFAMQRPDRYLQPGSGFEHPALDARVFELPVEAAASGLFLQAGGGPVFCLGKYEVR